MPKQNLKNHARYVPIWHFVTGTLVVAVVIGSVVNLIRSGQELLYTNSLIVAISLIIASIFWFSRRFALRAQDRAIRAEENLRHFALTGKLLDRHLRTSQIIALRFAPDDEFVDLAQKATEKKMRSKEIKRSIVKWKPDNHRV